MSRVILSAACWMTVAVVCSAQGKLETPPHWNADLSDSINPNSELKQLNHQRYPIGWKEEATFASGNAVALRIHKGVVLPTCPDDGKKTTISTTIDLPKPIQFATIVSRMRSVDFQPGESETAGAGITCTLLMPNGRTREFPRVQPIHGYGSLGGWKTYRHTIRVLPGYTKLNIRAFIEDASGSLSRVRARHAPDATQTRSNR
ncbi:hypothetical protein Poly51_49580 [Rubripirellula tenax]|uniref:Uncharacterized protein n=1 Tax=Rubripirellula tenax TaxID=2528015 RepID=A0A5C6EES0_9BACT|nr:hypothetical protein [Rubripirellula tenax]TWU47160.1 hypothetical protein Poly51_49580 [Rubripirellula tenax]